MKNSSPPFIQPHEVRMFREENREEAARLWHSPREGKPLAIFLYRRATDAGGDGHLYVALPVGWGVTQDGHQVLIETTHITDFKQGEEIAFWIPDTDIEKTLSLVFDCLGKIPVAGVSRPTK